MVAIPKKKTKKRGAAKGRGSSWRISTLVIDAAANKKKGVKKKEIIWGGKQSEGTNEFLPIAGKIRPQAKG